MKRFKMNALGESGKVYGYDNDAPLVMSRKVFRELPKWGKLHAHPNGYEFFHFLRGKGEMIVDDEIIRKREVDVLVFGRIRIEAIGLILND